MAVIFLVGDRAYKLKKPVSVGFLDFSRRPARLAACRREVELNRRFAPDVYLGVSDLTDPETGEVADHLVVMRRMPSDRALSALVGAGADVREPLRQVARSLAAAHAAAASGTAIDRAASARGLGDRWRAVTRRIATSNTRVVDSAAVTETRRLAQRFLDGRAALFEQRIARSRMVDGHGDLNADDVFCLPDGPRLLDCLEFDDELRFVDALDDAAFLATDLETLGRSDLAEHFFADYGEFAADPAPAALRHHYVAYRAWVRVLVDSVRAQQSSTGDGGAARARARGHAELALQHLRAGDVRLVLVGGLPATGKSTLASALAERTGAVLLFSDVIRKELAGLGPDDPAPADYRRGIYASAFTERTYAELLRRAELALRMGDHVVVDASWTDWAQRYAAVELASEASASLVQLSCEVPRWVSAGRLIHRGPGHSDATQAVAVSMAADADPWPAATTIHTLDGAYDDNLAEALACWEQAAHGPSDAAAGADRASGSADGEP